MALDKNSVDEFIKFTWPKFVNNGLSIVALNDETGSVVGVTTCHDPSLLDPNGFCHGVGPG